MAKATESSTQRWRRRSLTFPTFVLAAIAFVALSPVLVLICLALDVALRKRFATTRAVLALGLYFACEALGLVASLAVWLAYRRRPAAYTAANYRLQQLWARTLLGGAMRLYGMRAHVRGAESLEPGPFFLFVRHASTVDTLLAANFVAPHHPYRLRYVIKRELLWDPCLDVVGQRVPNVFIRRGSGDSQREIDALRTLARDLGPEDGVLIYPEGTRATATKRAKALGRIRTADPQRHARIGAITHVLPPRFGGPLGLIEERPDVDVVLLAHSGFEGVESLNDLWHGALIDRDLHIEFWRVKAADIPGNRAEREAWLDSQWVRLDAWVGASVGGNSAPPE